MKILFDMGHPAHVHFFRHTIRELEKKGHSVKVTARDKDVTLRLLEAYGIPYVVRPDGWRPLNLVLASRFIKKIARNFGADRLAGVHNPYVASAAVSLKKPCILFTDSPGTKFVNRLSIQRAAKVVTPECLAGLFPNQATYPGYKEMAYLHPDVFTPDRTVLDRYELKGTYFIVRFSSWDAHHDSGCRGMTQDERADLVKSLSASGKVVASVEGSGKVPGAVAVARPEDIHSLLAFSSGYVGEGATMAKEAAVLGVPSIFVSPITGLKAIDSFIPEGRIMAMERLDLGKISKYLSSAAPRVEMSDVNSAIMKALLE